MDSGLLIIVITRSHNPSVCSGAKSQNLPKSRSRQSGELLAHHLLFEFFHLPIFPFFIFHFFFLFKMFNANLQRNSIFNIEQIICICETLSQARDGERLAKFFRFLGPNRFELRNLSNFSLIRGQLYALYFMKAFDDFFKLIKSQYFPSIFHLELQELWFQAHYAEVCFIF